MKLFRGILSASFFFSLVAAMTITVQGQGLTINLIMSPNPSPRVGDWSTHRETAQLIVTNTSGASKQVKLSTQISLNGSLVAFTKNQSMPVLTIPPGAMTYDAGSLVPYSDVTFQGQIDQNVKRTGLLPEGMYQICVSLIDPSSFAQITQPVCQSFTILGYQQPILLAPLDTSAVNASSSAPPPIFSWTPPTPSATTPISYHIKIVEVMPGQTPRSAFYTNPSLFERDIMNVPQFLYTPDASPLRDGMQYVWSVQARDQFGTVLGQGDGWAVPFSFRAVLTSGQPQIVDNKKGLMFIPDGMGVLIGSPEYLKDVTVRGWDPSNKQGMNEKITLHHEGLYSMSIGDVAFEDGDPDRPIIIGMQYNGEDGQKHLVNVSMPAGMVFNVQDQSSDDLMQHSLGQKEWEDVLMNPAAQPLEDLVVRGLDRSHRLMHGNGAAGGPVNGDGVPDNGVGAPLNGSGVPTNGAGASINGDGMPDNGAGAPINGNGVPTNGTGAPVDRHGEFHPDKHGSFTLELDGQPAAMFSAGDVNGDGMPDLAINNTDADGDGWPANGNDARYYNKYKGKMGSAQTNPMYEDNKMGGTNPLYEGKDMLASPVIVTSGNGGVIGGFGSSTFELKTNDATGHYLRKKLPGKMKSGQITLTRGISTNTNLYQWISSVANGQNIRKNITITMMSDDGKNELRYALYDCTPTGATGSEQAIDPSDSTGKMELHGFSWGALSAPQGDNNNGNGGSMTDSHPCDTCAIDLMSYSWGGVALSFDSATVDSTPAVTMNNLPQHIDAIAGPFGNVTGNIDLDKGRMTVLEPITIPGTGDALLLITGRAGEIDPFPDPPNVTSQTIANVVKLAHRGEITSISSGGDNPTESRIKVQFHWDRQGKNDDKDNSIVEFVPDGSSDSGGTKSSRDYVVQYRETSFDAFYNVPSSLLSNTSSVFTPIVTGGGSAGGTTDGRLYPTQPSPITFTCEMGMSKNMYDWIKSSMNDRHLHQSGIIHRDLAARNVMTTSGDGMPGNHKDVMELAFTDAQITTIGFPALDAGSKDPAMIAVKKPGYPNGPARPSMTVSITPGKTEWKIDSIGSSQLLSPHSGHPTGKRQWDPVSFRLKIDGLEDACARVNKIEAFTWKQGVLAPGDGGGAGKRDVQYDPQKSDGEIGSIAFSLPLSDAKPFYEWHQAFVKDGSNDPKNEKTGTLEYLNEDGTPLFTFHFQKIEMSKISENSNSSSGGGAGTVDVELMFDGYEAR